MKSIQFKRNLTVIISTVFVVLFLYLIYTQVYTRSREEKLIQTRFRVLDQMGENLKAKMDSYKNNAKTYTEIDLSNIIELVLKQPDIPGEKGSSKINDKNNLLSNVQVDFKTEKLNEKEEIKNIQVKILESPQNIERENGKDKKDIELKNKKINDAIRVLLKSYAKIYNDDLIFNKRVEKGSDAPSLTVRNDSVIVSCDSLEFYLPNEFLLKNIGRKDLFAQSLVIADSSIIYCSLKEDLKIAYVNSSKVGKQGKGFSFSSSQKSDTLFLPIDGRLKAATVHSNKCYEIILSDGPYKLFLKPLKIGDMEWFIGGMVSKEDFQRERQSIAPWMIIILSLAFVMIILSLPFLKLRLMSKTELLGKTTIFQVALSLLLGVSFLVFYLFFQAHYFYKIDDTDAKLKGLSDEIADTLTVELKHIDQVLINVDKQALPQIKPFPAPVLNDTDILKNTNIWKVREYPYFDYIFWLGTDGKQTAQISPFSKKEKLINLKTRNYFINKDQWFWPFDTAGNCRKFIMESILSVKNSDYKAAISRTSLDSMYVQVMTGRLYSLIDPIIPKGYGFCIIDQSGSVWFHSNKYQNLAENFIEECDNSKKLQAALYSDISKFLNVNYYNNPYRIYTQRMHGLPLYLITLHDLRFEYSYEAQSFITTLILTAGLFLYVFAQLVMLLLLKRIFKKNNGAPGNFQIEFSKMRPSKLIDYIYLVIIMSISMVWLYIFIFQMPPAMAIISIFMTTTALITILFYHLQEYDYKSPAITIFFSINGFILLFLVLLPVWLYWGDLTHKDIIFTWAFPILLILIIIVAIPRSGIYLNMLKKYMAKKLNGNDSKEIHQFISQKIKPEMAYSLMIVFMVLLFGVMPILKFFNIAANLENEVHIRYGQLEMARAKELRNLDCKKYYERINNAPGQDFTDTVYNKRLNQGIYCNFWFDTKFNKISNPDTISLKEPKVLDSLINPFRPVYSDLISLSSKFLFIDRANNRPYRWSKGDTTINLSFDSETEDISGCVIKPNSIVSVDKEIKVLFPFQNDTHYRFIKGALFYILIIGLFILIFRLILITTRRLFGVSLIDFEKPKEFETIIKNKLDLGISVLLVNPTGIIRFEELKRQIEADLSKKNITAHDQKVTIIPKFKMVHDLFKDYQDPDILGSKIDDLVQELRSSTKLVVLVETNPDNILNYYNDRIENSKCSDPKAEKKADDSLESYRKTHDKLKSFLQYLEKLDVPMDYINQIMEVSSDNKLYQGLLESCSTEETFVMVDIASDTISNYKSKHVITRLLKRGLLIKKEDDIIVMNESFRDYLLSHYKKDEMQQLKRDMGAGPSHWAGFRIAILLVIVALFIFIFMSNQEFLNNINKLFITLGASIAGISSLFNLVVKKNT